MPAVSAMASAPQKVTRTAALVTLAPPTFAPTPPKRARNTREAALTPALSSWAGIRRTISKGRAAPTANVAAEVNAAWIGRAVVISDMPSSSRACTPSASFAISWSAT